MGDENLLCDLPDSLHQSPEIHVFRHRVDHGAQLRSVAVGDALEQLCAVAFQEGVVGCLQDNRRVRGREVARVWNDTGVMEDLGWSASAHGDAEIRVQRLRKSIQGAVIEQLEYWQRIRCRIDSHNGQGQAPASYE